MNSNNEDFNILKLINGSYFATSADSVQHTEGFLWHAFCWEFTAAGIITLLMAVRYLESVI